MTGDADPRSNAEEIALAVRGLYERHPYPEPVETLDGYAGRAASLEERRAEHHLVWPSMPYRDDRSVLIAGCGTSQAAKYAMRWPRSRVVGIDVSEASIRRTAALKEKHGLDNLDLRHLPVERAGELSERFDHVISTGVLHHLPDPDAGLAALRDVLAPGGAMHLMVYAPYGRAGIYLLQEYNRRLGIGTSPAEIRDLAATLKMLPAGHPLWPILKDSKDFRYDAGLADALLHPQDRPYSVPQFLDYLARAGLAFGRWLRQAPYLPHCGTARHTPHHERLARLDPAGQYAAMELFRGSMLRHSAIVHHPGDEAARQVDIEGDAWLDHRPIRVPAGICVTERLPPGAAGVLINRTHSETDIYLPIDAAQKRMLTAIDGRTRVRDLLARNAPAHRARAFLRTLWQHDQIVFDASGGVTERPA